MSYKTNPILNRIKITKGWKTPYLPTKTLNYSRDISLWFKVYLLLKIFLRLKKIQLFSSEIRLDQQNKKILYLRINKKKTQKKKRRIRKRTLVKILNKFKTPLLKKKNKNSLFFLYNDLISLKNLSFWNKNQIHKKILSKLWITKPKISNWLTTLKKIMAIRQNATTTQKYLKKNKNFNPVPQIKFKFYTSKQKQILSAVWKLKNKNVFLFIQLFTVSNQKKSKICEDFIINLKKKILQNRIKIRKINKFYKFFRLSTANASNSFMKNKNLASQKNIWLQNIRRRKINLFWRMLRKKLNSFAKTTFWKKHGSLNTLESKEIKTSRKKKNLIRKWKLFHNISAWLWLRKKKRTFAKRRSIKKIKKKKKIHSKSKFKKKKKARSKSGLKKHIMKKYSAFLEQKKFLKNTNKKKVWNQLQKINNDLQKNKNLRYYKYRLPYRKTYFYFLKTIANLKFKYLIQDFVQKYFSVQVEAKIVHVLNAQKNQKFFRLVFPIWKKKKNTFIKKKRKKGWDQKKIFSSSLLKLTTSYNNHVKQKITKKNDIRILSKNNVLVLAEKKKLKRRIKNSFNRIKRTKDFRYIYKYFIPTLMEFSRSLEPQLLADILSKVIRKAKKQTWMLNTVKYILQSIQLPSGVGYKIVLTGRINSKKKSRLIYITRKQITLQIFTNNMNYAYSQAIARIGTFGIKIWVYTKKDMGAGKKKKKKKRNEENNSPTAEEQI